jgi:MYXO-CTERM domain-containing protein
MSQNGVHLAALRALLMVVATAAAPPATAIPLLSEVYYDAVGTDDGQSFVELWGLAGTSLDGVVIEVVNGADGAIAASLPLAGAIGPDGLFVVADRLSDGTTFVPDADLLLNFDIQNGPDSVVLRDAVGVLDALGFGTFAPGEVFAGEGSPAVDVPGGASLARTFANVDTGDNATDFVELAVPTPGSAPLSPVPEPTSAALSLAGLAGLALRRRRAPERPRTSRRRRRRPAPLP